MFQCLETRSLVDLKIIDNASVIIISNNYLEYTIRKNVLIRQKHCTNRPVVEMGEDLGLGLWNEGVGEGTPDVHAA